MKDDSEGVIMSSLRDESKNAALVLEERVAWDRFAAAAIPAIIAYLELQIKFDNGPIVYVSSKADGWGRIATGAAAIADCMVVERRKRIEKSSR